MCRTSKISALLLGLGLATSASTWAVTPDCNIACPEPGLTTGQGSDITVIAYTKGGNYLTDPNKRTVGNNGTVYSDCEDTVVLTSAKASLGSFSYFLNSAQISVNAVVADSNIIPAGQENTVVGITDCGVTGSTGFTSTLALDPYFVPNPNPVPGPGTTLTFFMEFEGTALSGSCVQGDVGGFAKRVIIFATCDDGNECTIDSCDPATNGCVNKPRTCDDGNVCNGVEKCDPKLGCIAGTPLVCDDGNVCNGVETCDPKLGCIAGTPLVCDDGKECTIDTCDPTTGCVNTPDPACACVTRTQGYWFNHVIGGEDCVTLTAAFAANGGTMNVGWSTVTLHEALGLFWTKGKASSALCLARQKASTQLIAAIANQVLLNGKEGCANTPELILDAQAALKSCDVAAINAIASQLDAFNNSGDLLAFKAPQKACGAGTENKAYIGKNTVPIITGLCNQTCPPPAP